MRLRVGMIVLVVLVARPALGLLIPNVAFFDDFENPVDAGQRLRVHVKWGLGTGPENYNQAWGGDRAIRLKGNSGSGATSDASQVANFVAGMGGGVYPQAMTFTLQSQLDQQNPVGNHLTVQLNESSGGELARWYGYSSAITPRYDGVIGPSVEITDGAVHEFSIVYDFATGDCQWLHNDAVQWTYNVGAGLIAERTWVQDVARGANDYVWMDDMVVGYIPEPRADFDGDGDVDGADFLAWQRGESPDPLSSSDLVDWQANFGTVSSRIIAASTAVPEPATGLMLMLGMAALLFRRHAVVR